MNKAQQWIAGLLGLKASQPIAGSAIPVNGPGKFIEIGGQVTWISDKLSAYVKEGFTENDIVYAAVMMVMDKVSVAPWNVYKVVDDSSLKNYHGMLNNKHEASDWAEVRKWKNKALEPIERPDARTQKLVDLLKWANERTTFNELVAGAAGYSMITGNEFLWANLLNGGANKGVPQELFNMPAQYTSIRATMRWPQRVVGYQLNAGQFEQFTADQVMHIKYWNPEYGANGEGLYGMSPLKAGSKTIKRSNSAKKAGATQLDNNGAAGIVFVDDSIVPAGGREAQASVVKKGWNNEYTGADRHGKVAFSGYKMGYVQIGLALKDMDIGPIEASDLRSIFNLWGLPSQLGNDPEARTYNTAREAEKALTTRGALPHLVRFRNSFNKKLEGPWGGFKGICVDFDLSVYSELQEDQKTKWEWVSKLPVSSAYKLELMGMDVPDDPNLNEILVDGNLIPLRDVVNNMSDQQMQQIDDELNKAGIKY